MQSSIDPQTIEFKDKHMAAEYVLLKARKKELTERARKEEKPAAVRETAQGEFQTTGNHCQLLVNNPITQRLQRIGLGAIREKRRDGVWWKNGMN